MALESTSQCSSSWTTNVVTASVRLAQSRLAVAFGFGNSIRQADLGFFIENVLPPLPEGLNMDSVLEKLQSHKDIVKDTSKIASKYTSCGTSQTTTPQDASQDVSRWTAFPKDPAQMTGEEDSRFSPLGNVIDAIVSASLEGEGLITPATQTLKYVSFPAHDMSTIYEQKPSKPDGLFVPVDFDRKGGVYWYQAAVVGEYKNKDESAKAMDDRIKTVWNMYQQLREDPRRRFALAYTIENTAMRIWYCSRSEAFVSTPFNFITQPETFARFVLSIVYAKEHQVGWDTTMTMLPISTTQALTPADLMYDMTVHAGSKKIVYRTKRLISDIGARSTRGRGTRVWEVVKLDDDGIEPEDARRRALKDSWVDVDRKREGVILAELKSSDGDQAFQDVMNRGVLQVSEYGDVLIGEQDLPDHTRSLLTLGKEPPADPLELLSLDAEAMRLTSVHNRERTCSTANADADDVDVADEEDSDAENTTTEVQRRHEDVTHHDKIHHRSVFDQVGHSLYDQEELDAVFDALQVIVYSLQQIHHAGPGWVHRDISAGNILVLPDTRAALLANFEFAKQITDKSTHEVRTGTANFMAVEADFRSFEYLEISPTDAMLSGERPAKKLRHEEPDSVVGEEAIPCSADSAPTPTATTIGFDPLSLSDDEDDLEELLNGVPAFEPPHEVSDVILFFHNALHDLESTWWIAVYFLSRKKVISWSSTNKALANTLYNSSDQLKCHHTLFYDREGRARIMTRTTNSSRFISSLHPAVRSAAMCLERMRDVLIACYEKAETDPSSIGKEVADEVYAVFRAELSNAKRFLRLNKVRVRDFDSKKTRGKARVANKGRDQITAGSGNGSKNGTSRGVKRKHD